MNNIFLRISTVLAYGFMVAVNYLAVSLPLAGRDTGAISDSYANLFAPAGYAFSIWGVIYTLLAIYTIRQLGRAKDTTVARINNVFILNALLNAAWIFAWHYDVIWLSLIIMIGILATLIRIADIVRSISESGKVHWTVRWPFGVYFGWITVASIANFIVFLVSIGMNGFGLPENIWTALVLVAGAAAGVRRMFYDRSLPYGLVLIWAYSAIIYKHVSVGGFAGQYPVIIWTGAVCVLFFIGAVLNIARK